ncbi:MAG: hypothetical protein ACXAEN_17760 [Candidatus Thorarchaeota archaeon]
MKKGLSLLGILCLLLALALPIFAGPMSIVETPFWDSTPVSHTNPILGGDPGENPVRVQHWQPLQLFIVDGTYKVNRLEVYTQMCNYLPNELGSLSSFPKGTLAAVLYNKTPDLISGEEPILVFRYEVGSEMTNPDFVSLDGGDGVVIYADPTLSYSLRFSFYGEGADYYDMCIFRAHSDTLDGRGYIYSSDWNVMPAGEGQDIAMKLYGTTMISNGNGNGNGNGTVEEDCDGDGISDKNDTDDNNDCKGGGIGDSVTSVPFLTAFLFALGGTLLLSAIGIAPMSGRGIIFALLIFLTLFLVWYFWLFYAWTGLWV